MIKHGSSYTDGNPTAEYTPITFGTPEHQYSAVLWVFYALCSIKFSRRTYISPTISWAQNSIFQISDMLWLVKEQLLSVLLQSLAVHQQAACIFIDGLDEIDQRESPVDLLDIIGRISTLHTPNGIQTINICVSSRPEPIFNARLEGYPKLRLQELTKRDMREHINSFIRERCSFTFETSQRRDWFIAEVASKADGVFLWVSIALKSLERGSIAGDDLATLRERLDSLPNELETLYDEMLRRLGDDQMLYKEQSAFLFNIYFIFSSIFDLSYSKPISTVFHYAVVTDHALQTAMLDEKYHLASNILPKIPTGDRAIHNISMCWDPRHCA